MRPVARPPRPLPGRPATRLGLALLAAGLAAAGCHRAPAARRPAAGEAPPLPPASGTPLGYLIDAAADLALRPDQLARLRALDASLAARDADLDTQLRLIEARADAATAAPGRAQDPSAKTVRHHELDAPSSRSDEARRLHQLREAGDLEALRQAWALLDEAQRARAHALLEARGITTPAGGAPAPAATGDAPPAAPGS